MMYNSRYRSLQKGLQKGFSLIELMIVVLIIGISTSMAILFIDNSEERLKTDARRLLAMIQLARDDAIIAGQSLGLVVSNDSYYFTRLEEEKWQKITQKPYGTFAVSDDIELKKLIANKSLSANKKDDTELIYFLPTGETSEFQIWISNNNDSEFVLNSTLMGELSLKKSEE